MAKGKHLKHQDKKIKKILNLIRVILFIIILICSIYIINWHYENKKAANLLNNINSFIKVENTININQVELEEYNIDFKKLKEKNEDIISWLKIKGTSIEYPIVQAKDNSYYLTHSLDKSNNSAGWIFADYKNRVDGTDKNLVIYGHNRRDGTMFGSLKNILKPEWYDNKENEYIILETENKTHIYQVFSIYQIEVEDYYIKTDFNNDEEFEEFINTIKSRSIKDFKQEVTKQDNILTVSTCANNNKYRVVLHAKRIK